MPPYTLPDEKTKSVIKTHSTKGGGGTNEIRFEDLKDKEQLLIHAQKDFHLRVKNQERHNVGEIQHLTVGKEQRTRIGEHRSVDVVGKDALRVKETRNVTVEGDVLEDFKANHGQIVASQYYIKANELVVEADSGISLKVGSNFIVINSSGVSVKGTKIGLNSGGSALSKSVNGSAASPAAPEAADDVQPGQDKNYSGEPAQLAAIEERPYEGHWISFDLKDEDGKPVAGEYYEVTKPSGDVISGTLDVNGFARLWIDQPGQCQVCYPRRDSGEWEPG
jgi:type VI secretion system secreted protein VgrG